MNKINPRELRWSYRDEWPTWLLIVTIYSAFLALTAYWQSLPLWLLVPLAGLVLAWYASLQHELIHGHPTPNAWLNGLLGIWPLMLWVPYLCFRRSHIAHHVCEDLANPEQDPESFYLTPMEWARAGRLKRWVYQLCFSLLGRMVVGPWVVIYKECCAVARALVQGDREKLQSWGVHVLAMVPVLYWVLAVCEMPLWLYLLAFVWPGTGLLLVRSYLEHRPEWDNDRRTAVVESGWLMSLLFLNNNLHIVHHAHPRLPWYRIHCVYYHNRQAWLAKNGGYVFAGYREVLSRFALRVKDLPCYSREQRPS